MCISALAAVDPELMRIQPQATLVVRIHSRSLSDRGWWNTANDIAVARIVPALRVTRGRTHPRKNDSSRNGPSVVLSSTKVQMGIREITRDGRGDGTLTPSPGSTPIKAAR